MFNEFHVGLKRSVVIYETRPNVLQVRTSNSHLFPNTAIISPTTRARICWPTTLKKIRIHNTAVIEVPVHDVIHSWRDDLKWPIDFDPTIEFAYVITVATLRKISQSTPSNVVFRVDANFSSMFRYLPRIGAGRNVCGKIRKSIHGSRKGVGRIDRWIGITAQRWDYCSSRMYNLPAGSR